MALAVVSEMPSNAGFSSASASWSYNFTCAAGSTLLLVGVETNSNSAQTTDVTSVTYNGVGMTLVPNGSAAFATTSCRLKFYYLLNPPTGSSLAVAIVWTTTGGTSDCISGAITFSGNDTVTPFRSTTFTANGNSTGPATVDLTGTKVGNICIDLAGVGVTGGFSGRTNTLSWVLAVSGSTAGDNAESTRAAGNGGTVTVSHTLPSADSWGVLAIEVQAAVAGGGLAIGRGPSRSPRNIVHGPGSLFRRSTWASTEVLSSAVALAGTISGQTAGAGALSLAESLAGAIAGAATLTADLRLAEALAGSLTGAAALTGSLALAEALAGAVAGASALRGSLVETVALQGVLAGAATLTGGLAETVTLVGALAGSSTLTGNLTTGSNPPLAGSIAGASALVGALSEAVALQVALSGAGALTGSLALAEALQATIAGVTAPASASLSIAVALQGLIAGATSSTGNLTTPGIAALAGTIAGAASSSGSMSQTVLLQGAFAASSTLTGLTSDLRQFAGVLAGSGKPSGALALGLPLAGVVQGAAAVRVGTLLEVVRLQGAISPTALLYLAISLFNPDNLLEAILLQRSAREAIVLKPADYDEILLQQTARSAFVLQQSARAAILLQQSAREAIVLKTRS